MLCRESCTAKFQKLSCRDKTRLFLLLIIFIATSFGPFFALKYVSFPYEDRLYPIWSYKLFAGFPRQSIGYQVRISNMDSQTFNPPLDLFELLPTREGLIFSPSVLIELMAKSIEANDLKRYNELKMTFETFKFQDQSFVQYSVYKIKWNAIERFTNGKLLEEKHLVDTVYKKISN